MSNVGCMLHAVPCMALHGMHVALHEHLLCHASACSLDYMHGMHEYAWHACSCMSMLNYSCMSMHEYACQACSCMSMHPHCSCMPCTSMHAHACSCMPSMLIACHACSSMYAMQFQLNTSTFLSECNGGVTNFNNACTW